MNEMLFTDDEKAHIYRTKANGASDDDFATFIHLAQRCGLDPRANQIYLVKRQGKGTVQVGIDGLRLVADRTGKYAGSDDAEITGEDATGKYPNAARVTVWKMVDGQRCPFSATARWSEYYPGQQAGTQWHKMPCVMLAKVAEALALRKAFPADLSGLYTSEEMEQAGPATEAQAPAQRPANVPQALPPTASFDEKVRNAGLYFRRTIKGTKEQFDEFKGVCPENEWPDVALDAEQRGIANFPTLMRFALEGVVPEEEPVIE